MMSLLQEIDAGHMEQVEYLVKKNGLPKDSEWSDYTALRYTLCCHRTRIAKFLIEQGCRLNKTTKSSTNTPLHIAVKHEEEELIKILLDKGALINVKNNGGDTPLHFAARKKNEKIINLLLEKISSIDNGSSESSSNLSPLHIACMSNDLLEFEELIRSGASINEPVPLNSAFWPTYTPLHLAVEFERLEIVSKLLCLGADFRSKNSSGYTPLLLAMQRKHLPIVDLMLEEHECCNENINPSDQYGYSHFHIACSRMNPRIVGGFLNRGVDVNQRISEDSRSWPGYTGLHFAVENPCLEVVELLICYGADISLQHIGGLTALHVAALRQDKQLVDLFLMSLAASSRIANPSNNRGFSHFHVACSRNYTDIVRVFLRNQADVNEPAFRNALHWPLYTPLHIAVENQCVDTVMLLLERGARVNVADGKGRTPLHLATANGDEELASELLARGADVNACTSTEMTALHMAVKGGHLGLVKLLIQREADVNRAEALNLHTPLHLAVMNKHFEILEVLLREGADPTARTQGLKTSLHVIAHRDNRRMLDMDHVKLYSKIITSLVDAGCDIDATDASGQTALHMACLYRSPSGVYALLQNGANVNTQDIFRKISAGYFLSSNVNKVFREHIEKLRVLNFPASRNSEFFYLQLRFDYRLFCRRKWRDEEGHNRLESGYTERCEEELNRMRALRIDCYTSLYSIIFKNQNELAFKVLNQSLKEMLQSEDFDRSFPLYGYVIRLQFKKGMARMVLMRPAKDVLDALAGQGLPDSCSEAILQYLSNQELNILISVMTEQPAS